MAVVAFFFDVFVFLRLGVLAPDDDDDRFFYVARRGLDAARFFDRIFFWVTEDDVFCVRMLSYYFYF